MTTTNKMPAAFTRRLRAVLIRLLHWLDPDDAAELGKKKATPGRPVPFDGRKMAAMVEDVINRHGLAAVFVETPDRSTPLPFAAQLAKDRAFDVAHVGNLLLLDWPSDNVLRVQFTMSYDDGFAITGICERQDAEVAD